MFGTVPGNRKVRLNTILRGDVKKSKAYVIDPNTGKVVKVNFGAHGYRIKRGIDKHREAYRLRHGCDVKDLPITSPEYWSCKAWEKPRKGKEMKVTSVKRVVNPQRRKMSPAQIAIFGTPAQKAALAKGSTVKRRKVKASKSYKVKKHSNPVLTTLGFVNPERKTMKKRKPARKPNTTHTHRRRRPNSTKVIVMTKRKSNPKKRYSNPRRRLVMRRGNPSIRYNRFGWGSHQGDCRRSCGGYHREDGTEPDSDSSVDLYPNCKGDYFRRGGLPRSMGD
jgi:hypothetical protein